MKPRPWTDLPVDERKAIRVQLATAALEEARGSITEAALALGLHRVDFSRFVKAQGLVDFARDLRVRLRGHDRGRQWESEKSEIQK